MSRKQVLGRGLSALLPGREDVPRGTFAHEVEIEGGEYIFRASGSVLTFDGFYKVWERDENGETELPELAEAEDLEYHGVKPEQHFSQPPPRYSEATLIKELEQRGIEVTIDGERRLLGPGDAYYFDSRRPHRFRNIGIRLAPTFPDFENLPRGQAHCRCAHQIRQTGRNSHWKKYRGHD